MINKENRAEAKRSIGELAREYGLDIKTMRSWLKNKKIKRKIGEKRGRYFNPRQVWIIRKAFDSPDDP